MKYESLKHKFRTLWRNRTTNKEDLNSLESRQKEFDRIKINGKKVINYYESDWVELTSDDFSSLDTSYSRDKYYSSRDALSEVNYNFYIDFDISEKFLPFIEVSMIGKNLDDSSNITFVDDTANTVRILRYNWEQIYGDGILLYEGASKKPNNIWGRLSSYPDYGIGDNGTTMQTLWAKYVEYTGGYYYFYWTSAKTNKLYWITNLRFWEKYSTSPLTPANAPYSQIVERWNYPIKTITLTDKQYNDWNFSQLPSKKDYTRDHFFQFSYGKLCSHFFIKIDENKYRLFIKGNFLVKGRGTRVIETGEDVGTYERIYTPVVDMAMPGLWHLYYTLSSETTPATQWSYYIGGEEDDDIVRAKVKYLINIRNPNIYHEIRKFKT